MKRLARLSGQRADRDTEGVFVVDGPLLVADAADAGLNVEEVFIDAAVLGRPEVQGVLARLGEQAAVYAVPHGLRGHVDTATPNAMAAVVRRPDPALITATDLGPVADLLLVLCDVADPGNVGTLVRVAEAVGAGGVVLTGATVDPWSPKAVRASAGAVFRVAVETAGDGREGLGRLGRLGYRRVGTRTDAPRPYDELDLRGPVALVLGSEAHGLSAEIDRELDDVVALPMAGRIESLNVAMTGAVVCFEAARQRRAGTARP